MDYLAILKALDSGKAEASNTTTGVAERSGEKSELSEESPVRLAGPAECGPECYEVEPGRRIHQPWTGQCRAKFQMPEPRQVGRECWHRSRACRCACISCAEGLQPGASGECMICHGTGKALEWVH